MTSVILAGVTLRASHGSTFVLKKYIYIERQQACFSSQMSLTIFAELLKNAPVLLKC